MTGIPPVNPGLDNDHDDAATIANDMCVSSWLLATSNASDAYCWCYDHGDPSCDPFNPPTVYPSTGPCDFSSGQ